MSRRHNYRRRAERRKRIDQPPMTGQDHQPLRQHHSFKGSFRGWGFTLFFGGKEEMVPEVGNMTPMTYYEIHPQPPR